MHAPANSVEFDRAYRSALTPWIWTDIRVPEELKQLIAEVRPVCSLELGCGLGKYSRYLAQQGILAVGVDFSQVAIDRAQATAIAGNPLFIVGDVTRLDLNVSFDVSFDVGCFHCLTEKEQQAYATEVFRLLKPGSTHLLWALDTAPSDIALSPEHITRVFSTGFTLRQARRSRRRLAASHWYWLTRLPS